MSRCYTCGRDIAGEPVRVDGRDYCSAECAALRGTRQVPPPNDSALPNGSQRTKEARNAVPCTCPNPALHERECPYLLACAPYGRCARCTKALTLPSSMPGSGPDICGDCWRTSQRTNEAQVITEESKWPCFWCGSMQAHFTGYPGGLSTVPACEEHAKQYPREKAFGERKARTDSALRGLCDNLEERAEKAESVRDSALRSLAAIAAALGNANGDPEVSFGMVRELRSDVERLSVQAERVGRAWEEDPTSLYTENAIRELTLRARTPDQRPEPAALTEDAIHAKATELYEALEEVHHRNDGIVAIIRALEWAAQTSGGVITTPGTLPPGPRTPARGPEEAGTFPRGESPTGPRPKCVDAGKMCTRYLEGAEAERAEIVKYLRGRAEWLRSEIIKGGSCYLERDQAEWLADAIESGRYQRSAPSSSGGGQ